MSSVFFVIQGGRPKRFRKTVQAQKQVTSIIPVLSDVNHIEAQHNEQIDTASWSAPVPITVETCITVSHDPDAMYSRTFMKHSPVRAITKSVNTGLHEMAISGCPPENVLGLNVVCDLEALPKARLLKGCIMNEVDACGATSGQIESPDAANKLSDQMKTFEVSRKEQEQNRQESIVKSKKNKKKKK